MKGTVKWYNQRKRYGFIEGEEGEDIFVHQSALSEGIEILNEGDQVEFELEKTDRGTNAKNVKKV